MLWLLAIALGVVAILASLSLFLLASYLADGSADEQRPDVLAGRRAERQLHELARASFAAMLREARSPKLGR